MGGGDNEETTPPPRLNLLEKCPSGSTACAGTAGSPRWYRSWEGAVVPLHDIFVSQRFCWGDNRDIIYLGTTLPFEVLKWPEDPGSRSTARAMVELGALYTQRRRNDHYFCNSRVRGFMG